MPLEMNPEIRARWTTALRSGDYQQGSGYLHQWNDTFCCLGVLCDLAAKEGVVRRDQAGVLTFHRYDDEGHYLPEAVKKWAGLPSNNPRIPNGPLGASPLGNLNDEGWSFETIADAIDGAQVKPNA